MIHDGLLRSTTMTRRRRVTPDELGPGPARAAAAVASMAHRAPSAPGRPDLVLSAAQSLDLTGHLDRALSRFAGPLAGPCARIVHSVGGRIRPALTLACAAAGPGGAVGSDGPTGTGGPADETSGAAGRRARAMALGAAVELLHCATLVHDDVIDDAGTRRGVATVNAREGTPTAIVCGDVLIAAALGSAADVSGSAAAVLAATLAALCAGQAGEEALRFDVTATPEQVLHVAEGKTGSLLRAACLLGAGVAEMDAGLTAALGRFGMAFGLCLQMVDDVLDVGSTSALLGKPVGADIAAGVMTAPIVIGLRSRPELAGLLGSVPGSVGNARALHLLRTSGAIGETIESARALADVAATELMDAAGDRPSLLPVSTWARRYVDARLQAKMDSDLAHLVPGSLRRAERTA